MSERPSVTVVAGSNRQGGSDPLDEGSGGRATLRKAREAGAWVTTTRPGGLDPDGPATTVTADPRLTARNHHHDGSQGKNAVPSSALRTWYEDRPATTVVGSFCPDVISAPGYRTQVSRQNAEGSVRVTVVEGGVLQSFPADYPWRGSRSKQFEQVGNAMPPLLAQHILSIVLTPAPAAEAVA